MKDVVVVSVPTDSESSDDEILKFPYRTSEAEFVAWNKQNTEYLSWLAGVFIESATRNISRILPYLLHKIKSATSWPPFARFAIENLHDAHMSRLVINFMAKKIQDFYKFPSVQGEIAAFTDNALKVTNLAEPFMQRAHVLYGWRTLLMIGPDSVQLEVVLGHTSGVNKEDVAMWSAFLREHFLQFSLVKRVEANICDGKVHSIKLFKGCECLITTLTSENEKGLLSQSLVNGAKGIVVEDCANFHVNIADEKLFRGFCETCVDKGFNFACNLILCTDGVYEKVASDVRHAIKSKQTF